MITSYNLSLGMMEQWNDGIVGQQIKAKCNRREAKASFTQYPILPIFHFRFFVHPLFQSSTNPFFLLDT